MEKVKLGDIFNITSGGTPSRKNAEYYINGNIKWVKTGDLKKKYIENTEEYITERGLKNSSAKMYREGTVLIAMYGATIGAVSILKTDACTNQACAAFVKDEKVIPEYLYYFLRSRKNKFINDAFGGAQPNISAGYLKNIFFNLVDLKKQKEIVNKMNIIEDIIDLRKKQIEDLEELIKSQFIEMFDDSNYNVKIKDISNFLSRGKSPNYVGNSKIEVINQACIYWNEFRLSNTKYQDELKISKSLDKLIKDRDVLITSTGTGTLGRCNVFEGEENKYMADGHVTILRLNQSIINPIYFKYYFMQEKIQKKLYSECVNGSTNQIELAKDKFLNFNVVIPEISLQNKFEIFVKEIDKQKFEIQKSLEEVQKLQESLMDKYFGG